jgi:hypothetical protein
VYSLLSSSIYCTFKVFKLLLCRELSTSNLYNEFENCRLINRREMNGWVINGNGLDHYLIFFQCSSNEKLRLFTDSFFDAVCHTIVINGLLSCFRCYTVKITIMQKKLIKISTLQPLLLKCDPYKIRQLLSLDDHHSNYSVLHYD